MRIINGITASEATMEDPAVIVLARRMVEQAVGHPAAVVESALREVRHFLDLERQTAADACTFTGSAALKQLNDVASPSEG